MLLVIFGHSLQFIGYSGRGGFWDDPIFLAIYMFHMPLFMGYSGYFAPLSTLGRKDGIARVRSLIYPMIPWAIVIATLKGLAGKNVAAIPELAWLSFSGTYWFLWAAFLSFLILWTGQRAGKAAPAVYLGIMLTLVTIPEIWGVLPMLTLVFPFFIAGHMLRARGLRLEGARAWVLLAFSAALAALCFRHWNKMTYVYNNRAQVVEHPGEVLLMFCGAAAATITAALLLRWLSLRLRGTVVGTYASRTGRVTLEVYLAQGVVFAAAGAFASKVPGAGSDDPWTRWIAASVFAFALTAIIVVFVEATKRARVVSAALWGR